MSNSEIFGSARSFGRYGLGLALLVALAASSLSFAGKPSSGGCQTFCNDQYRMAVHACGKNAACQACVYEVWKACYAGGCTFDTSGCPK